MLEDTCLVIGGGHQHPIMLQHALADVTWHDAAGGRKQFETVIFGRVVTGADLNARNTVVVAYQDARRRGRRNTTVEHLTPRRLRQTFL